MTFIKSTAIGFLSLTLCLVTIAESRGDLIPEIQVRQAGLTRNWFTQVQMNAARQHVTGARLDGKMLFVLTSGGRVQSFDAETGKTLWTVRVGEPGQPCYGPAAYGDKVALVSGTVLYVLQSDNGKEIFNKRIDGAPGGSPVLSNDYVFVPIVNGRVEAYPVGKKQNLFKWTFSSSGNIFSDPIIAEDKVVWCTSAGYLYAAYSDGKGISYRFDSTGQLIPPATVHNDTIMVAGSNGNVYALDANRGKQSWRSSVGEGISLPALSVAGMLYVGTEGNTLHALSAETGDQKWVVSGLDQVVSVSEKHVYAVNQRSDVAIIDSETGDVIGYWNGNERLLPVENSISDRLYFVSQDGLVQCFHEIGADEPYFHSVMEEDGKVEESGNEAEGSDVKPDSNDPFAQGFDNSQTEDDPFSDSTTESDPFTDSGSADEDPFASDGFGSESDDSSGEDDPFGSDSTDEEDPFADF